MRKPTGVRPTFTGKAKLNVRGEGDDGNSGVVTSYGFSVALRSNEPAGEKREKVGGAEVISGANRGEERRAARGGKGRGGAERGIPFDSKKYAEP